MLVDLIGFEEANKLMAETGIPPRGTDPLNSDWGSSPAAQQQLQEVMALIPQAAPVKKP
jgi:hypothetical protein